MAKKFINITQTYHVTAIMDIDEKETYEDIQKRILEYINNAGGPESIIVCGGEIKHEILDRSRKPNKEDEENFECID